jgi:hypothetical protein
MMIVLSISLLMMVLIVPIFQVSTRAVQKVEQKLKTYEAARMILDLLESEIQQAVTVNERGEVFTIKNFAFQDNDPFTPVNPGKFYAGSSRREADCALYATIGSASVVYSGGSYQGSVSFPTQYSTHGASGEGYQKRMGGDVTHLNKGSLGNYQQNVGTIPVSISFTRQMCPAAGNPLKARDPVTDFWSPGLQWMEPAIIADGSKNIYSWPGVPEIYCMDLEIAFWDSVEEKWKGAAKDASFDTTSVYFSTLPKALRITITVCDREKKGRITLSRMVQMPCGIGRASVADAGPADQVLYTPNGADPTKPVVSQYDRRKDLKKIEPHLVSGW